MGAGEQWHFSPSLMWDGGEPIPIPSGVGTRGQRAPGAEPTGGGPAWEENGPGHARTSDTSQTPWEDQQLRIQMDVPNGRSEWTGACCTISGRGSTQHDLGL